MRYLIYFLVPFFVCSCQSGFSKKDPSQKTPVIHGHRGARGTHPENTLSAFHEALEAQADWIELDLVLSKDNIPVVVHDPTVSADLCLDARKKPLTRILPIKTLSVKQLKKFDCGSVPNPKFPEQKTAGSQTIPTLEEVLIWANQFPDKRVKFNLELKMKAPKKEWEPKPQVFVEAVVKLLRKYNQIDQSILQSFDPRVLKEAKLQEPKLKLSALFDKAGAICKSSQELGASIASPDFSLVTSELIRECHAAGIEVHPWTLNTEPEWKRAIEIGVDGIITDYPRKLRQVLNSLNRP